MSGDNQVPRRVRTGDDVAAAVDSLVESLHGGPRVRGPGLLHVVEMIRKEVEALSQAVFGKGGVGGLVRGQEAAAELTMKLKRTVYGENGRAGLEQRQHDVEQFLAVFKRWVWLLATAAVAMLGNLAWEIYRAFLSNSQ